MADFGNEPPPTDLSKEQLLKNFPNAHTDSIVTNFFVRCVHAWLYFSVLNVAFSEETVQYCESLRQMAVNGDEKFATSAT